jgi:hypothetical protein
VVAAEKVEKMDPAEHLVGGLARGARGVEVSEVCRAAERVGEAVRRATEKWEGMA